MANEMKHMKTTVEPWGEKRREFFFLYPLATPILDKTSAASSLLRINHGHL